MKKKPSPHIATLEPASTLAVFSAAPKPKFIIRLKNLKKNFKKKNKLKVTCCYATTQ